MSGKIWEYGIKEIIEMGVLDFFTLIFASAFRTGEQIKNFMFFDFSTQSMQVGDLVVVVIVAMLVGVVERRIIKNAKDLGLLEIFEKYFPKKRSMKMKSKRIFVPTIGDSISREVDSKKTDLQK